MRTRSRWTAPGVWLPAALVVVATVVAYLPAFSAGFVWDDDAYVTANRTLRSLEGLWRIWFAPGSTPQYYPLTFTTFWIEFRLWGLEPAGYHAVNVLLHAANAVLVWRLLVHLRIPGALAAALVFALHPVQVESVAWITERKNVLSGFFYLSALLIAVRGLGFKGAGDAESWPPPWFAPCLALFAAALLSKTVTCSLPAAVLLIQWWRNGRIERREVLAMAPLFALGAVLAAVTIWMERDHVGAAGADWQLSLVDRCLIASRALWFYAGKLAWPANLAFIYPRWDIDAGAWWQYLPLLGLLGVGAAALAWRDLLGRGPLAALLFFAGTLVPALGFFDVFPMRYTFVADHYQYLACLGLVVLAVGSVAQALARARLDRVGWVAATALVAVLSLLTWRQARAYESPRALWLDTLEKSPRAWMAHNNLGLLLQLEGELEEARRRFEAAIRIRADDDFAMTNLGNVHHALGNFPEAMARYRAAVAANPRNSAARGNLGSMLAEQGELEAAEEHLRAAVLLAPADASARNNLANVLSLRGDGQGALEQYEIALRLDDRYAEAHHNMAVLLVANDHRPAAIEHLRAAVAIEPRYAEAHYKLGLLLAAEGEPVEGILAVQRAVELSDQPLYRDALEKLRGSEP